MYRIILLGSFYFFLNSCNPTLTKNYLTDIQSIGNLDIPKSYNSTNPCTDKMNYIPDSATMDHTPYRYLRVNFHIMLNKEGKGNFNEEKGRPFIKQVLRNCNGNLRRRNIKMELPANNNTPALPIRYQYKLTPQKNVRGDDGIYFHYDDELYYVIGAGGAKGKNNFDQKVFKKYAIQKGEVLNIFVMGMHVDSMKSKTYKSALRGVGFGQWVKLEGLQASIADTIHKPNGKKTVLGLYNSANLIHHEIGHCLGLRHTWRGNDGCDDTPEHSNCWGRTKSGSCKYASNNVMDYNSRQSAWSPCQIGTAHYTMTSKRKKIRQLLEPVWCEFKKERTIIIDDDIVWNSSKDLEGHIVIRDNASLTVTCNISLPKKGKIIVYPKGKLILDGATLENDCGDQWQGIELWTFKNDTGTVQFDNAPVIKDVVNEVFLPGGVK